MKIKAWAVVRKKLVVKTKLPRVNVGKDRPTVEILHPKLKKVIYWHFAEDFEIFGYEK